MNISDFDHGKTKLDKINNYLQETFGFSLKKEDVTPKAIQSILLKVRDKQSEIVNESNINDFHKHPDYAKTIMVAEALAIMLKEVSPTQRKTTRKVKESKMTKKVAEHKGMKKHKHPHPKMEASKPDYIDIDKDGDKKEPMKKAAKDAKKKVDEKVVKDGNAFSAKMMAAKAAGEKEFELDGKKYKVKEGISSTDPKTGKKIRPGTPEWNAKFVKGKKKNESVNPRSLTLEHLRPLMEQDLDQAELVLAAKDMVDRLQKMAEDLASMQVEDLMPLTDAMRESFGTEQANAFSASADSVLAAALETIKGTREQMDQAVMVLTGEGAPMNDMMGGEMPPAGDMGDPMADPMGDDMAVPAEDEFAGDEAAAGSEGEPLGRIPKESLENAKKLLLQHAKNGKLTKASIQEAARAMAGK